VEDRLTFPHSILGGWSKACPQNMRAAAPWIALAGVVVGIGSLATWLFWPDVWRSCDLLDHGD
jgi:hypothetical protein